jgi:tetratricopeptide (TPR) repeat protein
LKSGSFPIATPTDGSGTKRASTAGPRRVGALRRFGFAIPLVAAAVLAATAPSMAFAGDPAQARLSRLDFDLASVVSRTEALSQRVEPGRGFITESQAAQRFEQHLYQFMVGDYDTAAEGFFALVTTAALGERGLQRDAEWYLAESLFKIGNFGTAEVRFTAIADDVEHPFHDDAVRRLLELYAASGQGDRFEAAYAREIVGSRVKPSDAITYSVAKSFYARKDFAKAEEMFASIPAESPVYARARYFLGVVRVASVGVVDDAAKARLELAIQAFAEAASRPVDSSEARELHDLALLAQARVRYELGQFTDAAELYSKISGDSQYLADKLYELVWTFVKQGEWEQAAQAVDIFLLAYPEHQYSARMALLRGQLHVKTLNYDAALASFEDVISEYTPLRDHFAEMAKDAETAGDLFARLSARSGNTGLPLYAVAMMQSDPPMARALALDRSIQGLSADIAVSEELVRELTRILGTTAGIGGYEGTRADIDLLRSQLLQQRLDLARVEEDWVWSNHDRKRSELEKLRKRREAVRQKALERDSRSPGYSDNEVTEELAAIEHGLSDERARMTASQVAAHGPRFDAMRASIRSTDARLASIHVSVGDLEAAEVKRIRDRLQFETTEVAEQRKRVDAVAGQAEQIGAGVTQAGFARLADFFGDAIMRADMGVVDVYWAQKLQLADKRESMVEMKNALIGDLERRFDFIRQNLPPGSVAASNAGEAP